MTHSSRPPASGTAHVLALDPSAPGDDRSAQHVLVSLHGGPHHGERLWRPMFANALPTGLQMPGSSSYGYVPEVSVELGLCVFVFEKPRCLIAA